MKTAYFLLFTALVLISCKKNSKHCAPDLEISGPSTFLEGESFNLSLSNLPKAYAANTYFYWKFADMSMHPSTVAGMIEVNDTDPITIFNADIRDQGNYAFRILNNETKCNDIVVEKTMTMIPKNCPCYSALSDNFLQIKENHSGYETTLFVDPEIDLGVGNTDYELIVNHYAEPYHLKFWFDVPIQDFASTYSLRNFYETATESFVEYDPVIQCKVILSPDYAPANTYRLENGTQNVYVRRSGNYIHFTLCDALFTNKNDPSKSITVNVKVSVYL